MTIFEKVQTGIEEHKGRKLDLTNQKDLHRLKFAIQREFDRQSSIISNVKNVLSGYSTFNESTHKTIIDNRKK